MYTLKFQLHMLLLLLQALLTFGPRVHELCQRLFK